MHNILIFSEIRSYLTISLEEQLKELNYKVINVGTGINEINDIKENIAAILMYLDEELLRKQQSLIFLRDKALEKDTPVFVIGDINDLSEIRGVIPQKLLKKEFQRPVDVKAVANQVNEYIELYGNHNKKKILVVDDSGAMLRNVKGWLEERYQVILANSGTMAFKYLSTNRPDLVLLDYEMPVLNGKQVLEMIRSESEFSNIPVIFLTSKNDKESIQQVLSLKPEGYILKTTSPEKIIQMIDEFFAKRKGC